MTPKLAALARHQWGAFRIDQALPHVHRSAVDSRLDDGTWEEVLPGIIVPAGTPSTKELDIAVQWLGLGGKRGIAGFAGGHLHGFPGCVPVSPVHVGVPLGRHFESHADREIVRIKSWSKVRLVWFGGIQALDRVSTLVTLAPLMNDGDFLAAMQAANFRRRLDLDDVRSRCARGLAGSPRIRWAVEQLRAGHDSIAEVDVVTGLRQRGHKVRPNVVLVAPDGRHAGPADALVDGVLALELDGSTHESPAAKERDARKDADYRALGVAPLRLPSGRAARTPEGVEAAVLAAIRDSTLTPVPGLRVVPRDEWLRSPGSFRP